MTEEEKVLATKLALLGIGIWSQHKHADGRALEGRKDVTAKRKDPNVFAIVTLESVNGNGTFFWKDHSVFYHSRLDAMKAAMERALDGGPDVNT